MDYVQFEKPEILNRFIDAWRTSGFQRMGYLYGSYSVYDQVSQQGNRLFLSSALPPLELSLQIVHWLRFQAYAHVNLSRYLWVSKR